MRLTIPPLPAQRADMKPLILALAFLFATALSVPAAAPAPTPAPAATSRTWTDTQGHTFVGEFVDSNKAEITIRSPAGDTFRIARAMLSAKDLKYADQAESAQPITATLDVSRVKYSVSVQRESHHTITTENWGYDITLTSKTMHPASGLPVEYQLYVRQAILGETMSSQPLKNRPGQQTLPTLDAGGKASFKTASAAAKLVALDSGYYWTKTGKSEDVNDKLEGIWVRVFEGKTMIAEYLSSEAFRKGGWPVEKKPGTNGY